MDKPSSEYWENLYHFLANHLTGFGRNLVFCSNHFRFRLAALRISFDISFSFSFVKFFFIHSPDLFPAPLILRQALETSLHDILLNFFQSLILRIPLHFFSAAFLPLLYFSSAALLAFLHLFSAALLASLNLFSAALFLLSASLFAFLHLFSALFFHFFHFFLMNLSEFTRLFVVRTSDCSSRLVARSSEGSRSAFSLGSSFRCSSTLLFAEVSSFEAKEVEAWTASP